MARVICVLLLGAAVAAWAPVPAAHASASQLSIMQDDRLLLWSGPDARDRALDQMQRLGVTTIHSLVVWRKLAPAPAQSTRPAFDATDPASYGSWAPYDGLVAGAQARGMDVLFTITGPVPNWASQCGARAPKRWLCTPRPSDYAAFVRAVATRYSGTYAGLPRVSAWALWNEPNHVMWLRPQATAARQYRNLAQAGLAALSATGHRSDMRLIGETAPGGGSKSTAPVDFLREVFCLDASGHPYRGATASRHGCRTRPRFAVTGVSDHPYTYAAIASPSRFKGHASDAPIGAMQHFVNLLDTAARYGVIPRHMPVYLTEFGFQSRPPDVFGVSLRTQAQFINYSDYVAYRNPRIASVAQYELNDEPHAAVFNTGLRFADGRAKPALQAYAMPIYVQRIAGGVRVFGLVRSARGTGVAVAIQNRLGRRHATFRTVASVRTNRWGYLVKKLPSFGGRWRLVVGSGDARRFSRIASEGP
jgi:hypothetical protein